MKKWIVIVISVLAVMYSCQQTESISAIEGVTLTDSISFPVGMSTRGQHSGLWENKKDGKKYFYFANLQTDKKIKLYSERGELEMVIPLDSSLRPNESIQDFEFISLDTILILHQYSNKISIVNRKGNKWKELDFNAFFHNPNGLNYEYYSTFLATSLTAQRDLILRQYVAFSEEDMLLNINALDSIHNLRNWQSDQFIKVEQLFADTPKFITGFKLYQHIFPKDSLRSVIELPYYQLVNNSVFVVSKFSSSIYEINARDLKLEGEHKLLSTKTKIGAEAIRVGKYSIEKTREMEREINRTSGQINAIVYNAKLKHYYVCVSKTTSLELLEERKFKSWQLQIYGSDFKKLREIDFDKGIYRNNVISSPRGFLLEKKIPKPNQYSSQKVVFHELVY